MASKTEAMYHPTSTGPYEDGDTTPFTVPGPGGGNLGPASRTKELEYLESTVHSSLTSEEDVDKCFAPEETRKGKVYLILVLPVQLTGSAVWCLHADLLARLRSFRNRCCRAKCRITLGHTRRFRIPSVQLY